MEILVVLVIAGLLMTLAPPALNRAMPGAQLRATVDDLVTTLRNTRRQAVKQGIAAEVSVTADGRAVTLDGSPIQRLPDGIAITIRTHDHWQVPIQASVDTHRSNTRLRFFPDGSTTGGAIELARSGRSYLIEVDWLLGRIRVAEEANGA